MMDGRGTHFNCAALLVSLLALAPAATAVAQDSPRVATTPVIAGTLTQQGKPLVGARVAVVIADRNDSRRGCGTPTSRGVGDSGVFHLKSLPRSVRARVTDRFMLCAQPLGGNWYRPVFSAPVARWDTLDLSCDLGRQWLDRDIQGRAGLCTVARAVISRAP